MASGFWTAPTRYPLKLTSLHLIGGEPHRGARPRNLQGLADAGGAGAALGTWGVAEAERVVHHWHAFQRGERSRAELRRVLVPVRMRLYRLLGRALAAGERRPRALARDLLRQWDGLWTLARHAAVEPTNNRAEAAWATAGRVAAPPRPTASPRAHGIRT